MRMVLGLTLALNGLIRQQEYVKILDISIIFT